MRIARFELERYFAKYEFSARYLLSCSDCEALSMAELLAMADDKTRRLWDQLRLGYTESPGHPALRRAIAGIYTHIDTKDTLVAAPEECIFLLINALLEPGDHMVCTFPSYQSLHEVARSLRCEVTMWQPDESRGWRFDLDDLADKFQPNTRLVVVNFPHNPTGYIPPEQDFKAIVDLARQRHAYLFSDEMYRFLEIEPGTSLPAACDLYDRAISLFGLSKTFGLPGLRIGWLATRSRNILKRVSMLKDYTTICNSAPSEILALMALINKDKIVEAQNRRLRRNLQVLDDFFQKNEDRFTWNRPAGGSICFPRMTAVRDTSAFCRELVDETGIMLAPSRAFQFGDRHVRIGFGRRDLPEVLQRFADYLDRRFC